MGRNSGKVIGTHRLAVSCLEWVMTRDSTTVLVKVSHEIRKYGYVQTSKVHLQ